ncbi:CLPTM1L (predicted), partial [Pycnogonum litorale]
VNCGNSEFVDYYIMGVSVAQVLSTLFIVYISYSLWTLYGVYYPKGCDGNQDCIKPFINRKPRIQMILYTSVHESVYKLSDMSFALKVTDLKFNEESKNELVIDLPNQTRNNGTMFCHIYVTPYTSSPPPSNIKSLMNEKLTMYTVTPLTKYLVKEAETFSLLEDKTSDVNKQKKKKNDNDMKPVAHWRSKLDIHLMVEIYSFFRKAVPHDLFNNIRLTSAGEFLPVLYVDKLTDRLSNYKVINESSSHVSLTIQYSPIALGKLRLWLQVSQSMDMLKTLGFAEKDTDEVKGIFADTNFYFLMLTFFVAALHILFDFLAFKNEISFWRNKKTMVGLSTRVVVWRCISTIIIFVYLMDQKTSLLVLIPAGIGCIIEVWKVFKALRIKLVWNNFLPNIKFGDASKEEKETEKFDSESMKYLSYVLYPLCISGAVYSLLYVPHKSWYSWCIQSLVNGVYGFGFLFMLPQLFVNYRLKSVAHLPWRAFMYKAFNTFIDDLFAFIITMPTAHRLACFRDDIVFVIYLYQRWLYPVDKKRVNEYGESYSN